MSLLELKVYVINSFKNFDQSVIIYLLENKLRIFTTIYNRLTKIFNISKHTGMSHGKILIVSKFV